MDDIEQQCNFLESIADYALHVSDKYLVDESEIVITKTTGITVSTRSTKIESVEFNNYKTLEITVFCKKRKGTARSNNFSKEAITCTIEAALNIAKYTSVDIFSGIADKELLGFNSINLDLFHPIDLNIQLGMSLTSIAEQTALKYDTRIVRSDGSKFNGNFITKVFGNSHGMLQSYNSSQYSLYCSMIGKSNDCMEQNYEYTLSRSFNDLCSPEWIGTECARRTLQHLNPKKIKTTEAPVLFVAEMATSLFQHLAHAIHGKNVYRQSTFLLNYLGKKIFPSWISIEERPFVLRGLGSAPFDSEGVCAVDRIIVKNGILNDWLLDSYSARKIGLKSTGHADGIYNWYISIQNVDFIQLVQMMHRGLVVTNIIGQGVNIITGDYSRGISGFWVEHGEIVYPVHEVTIAGNLKTMFNNIHAISNDIEKRSCIRCGSVLLSSMKIAGI